MRFYYILALIAAPVLAEKIDLAIDPAGVQIHWALAGNVHTVHGTFKLKQGGFWFDPGTNQAGGLLVVDATSGESGSGARDSRMHKNVLESAKFPEITFAPDRVEGKVSLAGSSECQLHGVLTIHGAPHEVLMKVDSKADGKNLTGTVSFPVPYVEWGMKDPSNFLLRVDHSAEISIEVHAHLRN